MKLSCLPVSLFPEIISGEMDLYEWTDFAHQAGLDAVDFSILFLRSRTRREISKAKEALNRAGMSLAMITTYPDFTDPSPVQRDRELAHTYSDIAVAAELEASYVRITAGQACTRDVRETLDGIMECFDRCEAFARQAGVKLVYENHAKPGAWEVPDFDFNTAIFLQMAEMTKGKDIGINFDTANTWGFGDDPVPVFKKVLSQVETIHVADIRSKGSMEYTEIGQGTAPIKEILNLAKRNGFDGLVSIEEASMHGVDGIERAVQTTRKIWVECYE